MDTAPRVVNWQSESLACCVLHRLHPKRLLAEYFLLNVQPGRHHFMPYEVRLCRETRAV